MGKDPASTHKQRIIATSSSPQTGMRAARGFAPRPWSLTYLGIAHVRRGKGRRLIFFPFDCMKKKVRQKKIKKKKKNKQANQKNIAKSSGAGFEFPCRAALMYVEWCLRCLAGNAWLSGQSGARVCFFLFVPHMISRACLFLISSHWLHRAASRFRFAVIICLGDQAGWLLDEKACLPCIMSKFGLREIIHAAVRHRI